MKLFLYSFREFDEKDIFDALKEKYGFEYGFSAEYPSLENAALAKGYDAISMTPCTMDAELLDAFCALGVKYVAARSIGYDHIDIAHASGIARLVKPMAMAATAAGCDGLMIEVHNNPSKALCDGAQSLTPDQFDEVAACVDAIRGVLKA